MSSPAATTIQTVPLSNQIGVLQRFLDVSGIIFEREGSEIKPCRLSDCMGDGEAFRGAWLNLKEHVLHKGPQHVRAHGQRLELFIQAQEVISDHIGEMSESEVTGELLRKEGVDPFMLAQHVDRGLLFRTPVHSFNLSAANYLRGKLKENDIKLGDLVLTTAQHFNNGRILEAKELEGRLRTLRDCLEIEHMTDLEGDRSALFGAFENGLRILVPYENLKATDFFSIPVITRDDRGLLLNLGRQRLIDPQVLGAFLTRLGAIPEVRDEKLAVV